MDTAGILKKCGALPGVELRQTESYAELLLSGSDGRGQMRFIPMFPGLTLALISVGAPSWPAPVLSGCAPEAKGPLIINYCIRGRCELVLNDSKSVFLTSGHISLTERFARGEYVYPGRVYEGIEIFIDPGAADGGLTLLRDSFGVDPAAIREKYCPGGDTYIGKMQLPESLCERLRGLPEEGPGAGLTGMKTGVIDLLALLMRSGPEKEAGRPVYYTRFQVEIAKQIEKAIVEDLPVGHSVREFAERFSVSQSSIKNYFSGVFGESISQYTARRRMLLAAELLENTRLSVIEVAERVGYMNQSKFSAAFRRAYSCAPLEYRRRKSAGAGNQNKKTADPESTDK